MNRFFFRGIRRKEKKSFIQSLVNVESDFLGLFLVVQILIGTAVNISHVKYLQASILCHLFVMP